MINTQEIFNFTHVEKNSDTARIIATWKVSSDISYFDGHFPNNPILPAIAYIDLCSELLSSSLGKTIRLKAVNAAKFLESVKPHDDLSIELTPSKISNDWSCQIRNQKNNLVCKMILNLMD